MVRGRSFGLTTFWVKAPGLLLLWPLTGVDSLNHSCGMISQIFLANHSVSSNHQWPCWMPSSTVEVFFKSLSSPWSLGRSIATCTAWYTDLAQGRHRLHSSWVGLRLYSAAPWIILSCCFWQLPWSWQLCLTTQVCNEVTPCCTQAPTHAKCYRHQFFTCRILSRICPTWCSEKAPRKTLVLVTFPFCCFSLRL